MLGHREGRSAEGKLSLYGLGHRAHGLDARFHAGLAEVAEVELDGGGFEAAGYLEGAVVAVPAVGGLGRLAAGQHGDEARGHGHGVGELASGRAYVDHLAPELGLDRVGREALGLDLASLAAVEGVADLRAQPLDREEVHALARLLVGGEDELERAVLKLGVGEEVFGGGQDLGDAGLVVGAEERGAVGNDDGVAQVIGQVGIVGGVEDEAGAPGGAPAELDGLAVVVGHEAGLHVRARDVARRVDVGHEADRGSLLQARRRRQAGDEVAVLVEARVGYPEGLELGEEEPAELPLGGGGGDGLDVAVAGGLELGVADQPVREPGHVGFR